MTGPGTSAPATHLTVAVLGTGTMGSGMARSLLRNGFAVRAWNRTADRAAPLASDGATVLSSPAEAVQGADVVLVMLYDVDAVRTTLDQVGDALPSNAIVLQSSTIGPDGMTAVGQLAAGYGWKILDSPVVGTKEPAEDGKLVVLVSGDADLRKPVQPVLDALASKSIWAGPELGQASALKLACNSWVAGLTAAEAQALALVKGFGLDQQLLLDALADGGSDSPYLHSKGPAMIKEDFPVQFALDGVRKDMDLMAQMAGKSGVGTPLLDALRSIFGSASAEGYGKDDIAAVIMAF